MADVRSIDLDGVRVVFIPIAALPVGLFPPPFREPCPTCQHPLASAVAAEQPYGFVGVECEIGHIIEIPRSVWEAFDA
jgi:hypothetical protein